MGRADGVTRATFLGEAVKGDMIILSSHTISWSEWSAIELVRPLIVSSSAMLCSCSDMVSVVSNI